MHRLSALRVAKEVAPGPDEPCNGIALWDWQQVARAMRVATAGAFSDALATAEQAGCLVLIEAGLPVLDVPPLPPLPPLLLAIAAAIAQRNAA
ncbi:hypothetical protein [Paraburkholderia lycopersici]|uniref:hypothetical protein n=1 Tax=Paraburkholderia lycopersici TaxID=416944 RepID=UPI00116123DC|nr:hypothetical protein [Paraburkholderia lycopersici]